MGHILLGVLRDETRGLERPPNLSHADIIQEKGSVMPRENGWPLEEELLPMLKQLLSAKRYEHSLNVAERAVELAERYGGDREKARLAGLIHDICKNMPKEEQLSWIHDAGITPEREILACPQLYHAIAGYAYAKNALNIRDSEILNAIRYHTTGRAGMSLMEEIVYLADLTSRDRKYPDAEYTRLLADKSIPEAMVYSFEYIIPELLKSHQPVCRDTIEAYNDYVLALGGRGA